MPLSRYGLCDAEIITPAAKSSVRVRYATPGVVITPAKRTRAPCDASPPATNSAIHVPDSRVSAPIRISAPGRREATSSPSAAPKAKIVAGSSGYSPATPRIPSVPNSSFPTDPPLLFFHGHADGNLRRRPEAHVRVLEVRVHAKFRRS